MNADEKTLPKVTEDFGFRFPAYVKQIGNLDKRLKIYMEDYVHTYLNQYAHTCGGCEKLAVLLGKYCERDGARVLVISGAVKAQGSETQGDTAKFNDEAWLYVNEQACKYFSGLSVVGWAHIQPEMGIFLSKRDESFHLKCFKESEQVLFLMDQTEDIDCFYIYNDEEARLSPAKGYFIYYDKNESMQDYMIDNSISKPKEEAVVEQNDDSAELRIDAAKKIREVLNKKAEENKRFKNGKYAVYTLVTAAVCAAFIVMGSNILSGMDKISSLETQLTQMRVSYNEMSKKLDDTTGKILETKAVFDQQTAKENVSESRTGTDRRAPIGEYTLQYGDTLWDISRRFYGTENRISDILTANNISENDTIYAGQKIIIP